MRVKGKVLHILKNMLTVIGLSKIEQFLEDFFKGINSSMPSMPSGFWIKEERLSRGEAQIPSLAQGEGED